MSNGPPPPSADACARSVRMETTGFHARHESLSRDLSAEQEARFGRGVSGEVRRFSLRPWRLALACAGVLTLAAGGGPEYDDEHYAMSMAPTPGAAERGRATRSIPLPNQALLAAVKAPECETPKVTPEVALSEQRPTGSNATDSTKTAATETASAIVPPVQAAPSAKGQETAAADLEKRIALEYERACYKQAEAATRARLRKLQVAVRETITFVKRQQERSP